MGGFGKIGLIIPFLIFLVLVEYVISKIKNIEVYRTSDTIVNISCGLIERLFDFFFIAILYSTFLYIFDSIALWHFQNTIWTWLLTLLLGDFLAYWHHRLSHEINFLWAAHIVHHQSEELNITTVFRVSAFAVINRAFFWVWMPILGFSPEYSASVILFIGSFQFLTHTRLVGRLGFLEHIFVTPSSHRVHHGRNNKYIDTNYGHVFIFWDKIFGTFQPEEEEEPVYGIVSGFPSSNPYWAHFYYWIDMLKRAKSFDRLRDKVKLLFMKPNWAPKSNPDQSGNDGIHEPLNRIKYRLDIPAKLTIYLLAQMALVMGIFIFLIIWGNELPIIETIFIVFFLLFSVLSFALLMEKSKYRILIESIRLIVLIFLIRYLTILLIALTNLEL